MTAVQLENLPGCVVSLDLVIQSYLVGIHDHTSLEDLCMPGVRLSNGVETKKLAGLEWMKALTNVRLHRLAVLTGSACSGTKSCRIDSIQKTLDLFSHERSALANQPLSLVSIDMGIRNLAYAHFTARAGTPQIEHNASSRFAGLKLKSWKRFDVSSAMTADIPCRSQVSHLDSPSSTDDKHSTSTARTSAATSTTVKHIFEPWTYASRAYMLISDIIRLHKPTQILIERQRFRSGGGSAVQEWTIRVGVLEGMLYAVLKTINEITAEQISVRGIQPTRVNSYWLEEGFHGQKQAIEVRPKLAAREAKKFKINIVGEMLNSAGSGDKRMDIDDDARASVENYLNIWGKDVTSSRTKAVAFPLKLDDLADCFLQGLAWIQWQDSLYQLQRRGRHAFGFTAE